MTNSKSSALSVPAPSMVMIHLRNGAQFLNDSCIAWFLI